MSKIKRPSFDLNLLLPIIYEKLGVGGYQDNLKALKLLANENAEQTTDMPI